MLHVDNVPCGECATLLGNNRLDFAHQQKLVFELLSDPKAEHPEYPSIFCISGQDADDEAERFADLVQFLKRENVIQDYSQVALLLHSVRLDHSGPFIDALDKKGIPAFCPRARAYFENEEVRLMVACLALIAVDLPRLLAHFLGGDPGLDQSGFKLGLLVHESPPGWLFTRITPMPGKLFASGQLSVSAMDPPG